MFNVCSNYRWFENYHIFSVFSHPVPENRSGQFIVDQLQKRLENLGAVRSGAFAVDCETFQSLSGVPGGPGH